ncbi:MAG: CAP domain-containing protein [Paracoccaceae bacterium]
MRLLSFLFAALVALSACTPTPQQPDRMGPDGKPLPKVYRIGPADRAEVKFGMLDSVNSLRDAAGLEELRYNDRLDAAAATHARDMSVQNRPWHFGSDGSSPIDRVRRVGYEGRFLGETISETYETETVTLAAWMDQSDTRDIILNPRAREMGFAWFQEPGGKIWWTLVMGTPDDTTADVPQG